MEIEVTQYVIKVDVKQSLGIPKHKPQNGKLLLKAFIPALDKYCLRTGNGILPGS